MTRWVFVLAVSLGAFLLFLVQPLIGRFILPWFGGGHIVWTGCLVFFQTALLAGYAYAHLAAKGLGRVPAARVHLGLLAACCFFLPLRPDDALRPTDGSDPLAGIVWVLVATVGVPYLVLATTGPLLQSWYYHLFPGRSPYRLFALSNLGSLIGLFAYPFAVEPWLTRVQQSWVWSLAFGLYAVACGWCAWKAAGPPLESAEAAKQPQEDEIQDELTQVLRERTEKQAAAVSLLGDAWFAPLLWLALACVPSILLVATTSQMCQEVAVVPFLWTAPLGLYLLSFVICFDRPRWYRREFWGLVLLASLIGGEVVLWAGLAMPIAFQVSLLAAALFAGCMVCHGELAAAKPKPERLTTYYLSLSAGGALGGLFVGLGAPRWFPDFWELPVGYFLTVAVVIVAWSVERAWWGRRVVWVMGLPVLLIWGIAVWIPMCGAHHEVKVKFIARLEPLWKAGRYGGLISEAWGIAVETAPRLTVVQPEDVVYQARDEYGVLRVRDTSTGRKIVNGRIEHGFQPSDPEFRKKPASYYGPSSGLGIAMRRYRAVIGEEQPIRIGVVGLGSGAVTTWARHRDSIAFYELSPHVEQVAREYFTFLSDTDAEVEVRLGDARITMERELAQGAKEEFDVLAIDAFSSDAIPQHLLTREAMEVYFRLLKPNGVLAVHVSNRYLDLAPVVRNLAVDAGWTPMRISDLGESEKYQSSSLWVLVTRNERFVEDADVALARSGWIDQPPIEVRWSDDFGSLWQVLPRTRLLDGGPKP